MNSNASIARFVSRAGKGIRVLLPGLFFLSALFTARSQETHWHAFSLGEFRDPRGFGSADCHSILIIAWHPAPGETPGEGVVYQISGLEGYHTLEQVEHFLDQFYQIDHQPDGPPNVIVAYNNWGAAGTLSKTLEKLSKTRSFGVSLAGGYAFKKAILLPEPEARLKLIKEAYARAQESNSGQR